MTVSLNKPNPGDRNWDVPVNQNWTTIENELNAKADTDLSNLSNGLTNTICTTMPTTVTTATLRKPAVVIQNYRSAAGFFRVWSDGFIEQGGIAAGGPNSLNVSFFVPFSSTTYVAEVTGVDSTSTGYIYSAYNRTTTGMTIYTAYGGATAVCAKSWYACGY